MHNLKGKKILMFSPHNVTQHYCDSIVNQLTRLGAVVYDYDERPSQGALGKIIIRYFNKYLPNYFEKYIRGIIDRHNKEYFDYVFAIRAEGFTPNIVKMLRSAYPNAKFILYMWDLLGVRKIDDIIDLFDRTLTFDIDDYKSSKKFIFRPTFCAEDYELVNQPFTTKDNDVMFVGTLHTDRYIILNGIKKAFEKIGVTSCFKYYVPAKILYLKNKLTKRDYASFKEVRFTPFSASETVKLLEKSKSILDLKYNNNENLSMRAFEALVTQRKYITNNPAIKYYDFYDSQNILLISERDPIIPQEFFEQPFKPISQEIIDKYRVAQWVDDVFFNSQQNFLNNPNLLNR